jgi:putative peptide zinc metalloprotease protein
MSDRPRLRQDLIVVEQSYRGEQSFIVKDPSTRKYFRFRPAEVMVMRSLDGERTVAEAAAALLDDGIKVSTAAVGRFAEKLKSMGLCERSLRETSVLLMERLRAQRRARLRSGRVQGDILRLRFSFGDPDELMNRTMPYLRFFFTRGFVIASVALFAVYLVILAAKWSEFAGAMAEVYTLRASVGDYVLLYIVTIVMIAIHELAHGFTCKNFGGEVHEIGAMMFYFDIAFFCNVNDAWTFPDLKPRLWVTAAGAWIEMVVASIAAVIWWVAEPGTFISNVALAVFLVGGLASVLINMNPLVPLDGYYALSDWLEVPNLRRRAFAHTTWLLKTRWLGMELPMPPADEREQRIFVLYGTLAAAYTGMLLCLFAALAYGWVSRIFGAMGLLALLIVAWISTRSLRGSLRRAVSGASREMRAKWAASGRLAKIRNGLVILVLLIAVTGLAPWPITVTGPFVVSSTATGILAAPDSGVVVEVMVREGSRVDAGRTVVLIRNLELERELAATSLAVDSLGLLAARARARGDEGQAGRIAAQAQAEAARLAGMRERVRSLVIRAPVAGVVASPRPDTLLGRTVSVGDTLLRLAEARIEARIALAGAGASLARVGQRTRLIAHADPGVRLDATLASVAPSASPDGMVESRVPLVRTETLRPGMTGEASIRLRESNLWGALWWAIRSRIRTDVLL